MACIDIFVAFVAETIH